MNSTLKTLSTLAVGSVAAVTFGGMAQAGTITYTSSTTPATVGVPTTLTNWGTPTRLSTTVPLYSGSQPLLSVTVRAIGNITGNYSLTNRADATSDLFYGNFVGTDTLRANINLIDPSGNIPGLSISPIAVSPVGGGELTPGQNFSTPLSGTGQDSFSSSTASILALFTGVGNYTFAARALNVNQVAKSGGIPVEVSNIFADVALEVTYTFQDEPSASTPEPGTLLGLGLVGLAGLVSRRLKK